MADGSGPKSMFTQAGAEPVDCHGHVLALVSIDPHHYPGGVETCDGGHSCLLVLRVGWPELGEGALAMLASWPGSHDPGKKESGCSRS